MRGFVNDSLRWLIGMGFRWLGLVFELRHRVRIRGYRRRQHRLRRRYAITDETPILSYGPALEGSIRAAVAGACQPVRWALTSGSTAAPKRIPYTAARLGSTRLTFVEVFSRLYRAVPLERRSLYVFSSLSHDESLTAMLLQEAGIPCYVATLQAPHRVQVHPAMRAAAERYGSTALRLWILSLANPGILYATNPSTLSTFLDELAADWARSSRLVRDYHERADSLPPGVAWIARRLASRGSQERIAAIAAADRPLPFAECVPGVEAYVCWTGGYVQPFLHRIDACLPPGRYRRIPMYSMSTETVETVSHFRDREVCFLPLADGVMYEFLEENATDRPENLRGARQLEADKAYTMVVSDAHGLRRYQTGDVFLCKQLVDGLPDLHFLRRRALEYSFTGEKLTGEQVGAALAGVRTELGLGPDTFLTCVPSHPSDEPVPHYKIVLVERGEAAGGLGALAARCEARFREANPEYRAKVESGRLAPVRPVLVGLETFVALVGGERHRGAWEAQFKFLPLYRRTWEDLRGAALTSGGGAPGAR